MYEIDKEEPERFNGDARIRVGKRVIERGSHLQRSFSLRTRQSASG